ncbi:MAG: hypothetical protein HY286_10120 [Planctomycetes bacterium]|nr:hypothetical protein [Planctomycetota bacterium]
MENPRPGPQSSRVVKFENAVVRPLYQQSNLVSLDVRSREKMLAELDHKIAAASEKEKSLLLEAHEKAARIVKSANDEVEAREIRAMNEAMAKYSNRLEGILDNLEKEVARYRDQFRQLVTKYSFDIATAFLHKEIEKNPEVLIALVEAAVGGAKERKKIIIHVHPADADFIEGAIDRFKRIAAGSDIKVMADTEIPARTARLETEAGYYLANLDGMLAKLRGQLIK